jgi:hypothetical protein
MKLQLADQARGQALHGGSVWFAQAAPWRKDLLSDVRGRNHHPSCWVVKLTNTFTMETSDLFLVYQSFSIDFK